MDVVHNLAVFINQPLKTHLFVICRKQDLVTLLSGVASIFTVAQSSSATANPAYRPGALNWLKASPLKKLSQFGPVITIISRP